LHFRVALEDDVLVTAEHNISSIASTVADGIEEGDGYHLT